MTPEERNMLADLANKIAQTPAPPKDPDAEAFIRSSIGSRPDALYMMTQTVLIQNIALQRAQQQIQDLQQRQSQPVAASPVGGSFLNQQPPQSQYAASQYQQPQYAAPQYQPAPASGMSSFLRGAAQTAAGVAAGTLAVEGIESLFHHGGGGFGPFGGSGFMGSSQGGETIIENNYYDDPNRGVEQSSDRSDQFSDLGNIDTSSQDDSAQDVQDVAFDDSTADDTIPDDAGSDDNFA